MYIVVYFLQINVLEERKKEKKLERNLSKNKNSIIFN